MARLLAAINLGHVDQKVADALAVTPLVIVPADKLDKVVVERDACLGVEDGRVGVANHIRRDNIILGVSEDSLIAKLASGQVAFRGGVESTYP